MRLPPLCAKGNSVYQSRFNNQNEGIPNRVGNDGVWNLLKVKIVKNSHNKKFLKNQDII